jgi:hypothetical protein
VKLACEKQDVILKHILFFNVKVPISVGKYLQFAVANEKNGLQFLSY